MSRSVRMALAVVLAIGLATAAVLPAGANSTGNTLVGGFEIDGNYFEGFGNASTAGSPVDPRGDDWGTPVVDASARHVVDGVGSADDTVLDDGHEDRPLSEWRNASHGNAPAAADMHNVWAYDRVVGGDSYAYFAWDRAGTAGQVTWFVELNQRPNTVNVNGVSVPDRSPGDLRLTLRRSQHELTVTAIDRWVGPADTAWQSAGSTGTAGLVNDSTITTPDGPLSAQQFLEFGFNLTQLFGADTCGFGDYIMLNLRSTAGGATAELKDYMNTPIEIDSRCGDLTIEKHNEDGSPVGGAAFTVTPNPLPGRPADPPLTITDNDANDADPTAGVIRIAAVEPGTYTVSETTPPPGYVGPAASQTATIDEFGSETVTFQNALGSISWAKHDATTGDAVCCATFGVVGTAGAAANDPWNVDLTVTDNDSTVDTDPDVGQITVDDLPTGTYTVTETAAPAGYTLPADPTVEGVVISATEPDASIAAPFRDPQRLTDLSVRKIDASSEEPLDGAVFQLYRDDGDGVQDAPDGGDVPIGDPCTTGRDGPGLCTVADLPFGAYYWYEISPPPGYVLPADRTSPLLAVNVANAGEPVTYTFTNGRLPGALRVEKIDATDRSPLGGAEFDLHLDNGDGTFGDGDTRVGSCTTHDTGEEIGTCTVEDLDFGTYFWVETTPPPGYARPADPVSDPVVINSGNVGRVQVSTFEDPRSPTRLVVRKLDATNDDPLAGAEFDLVVDRNGNREYDAGIDAVVDSCTTAGEAGSCAIGGLDFGTYFWVETAPPPGFELPAEPVSGPITIDASNAGTEPEPATFRDPRLRSELTVRKVDEQTGEPLAGGEFGLYQDVDGEDEVVGTCVTDADGTCSIGDLDFGTYHWVELSAPAGYEPPANRLSPPITINASNAGGSIEPFVFRDPRLRSELAVRKVDARTGEPLAGAEFELRRPTDGEDEVAGSCTTGADGTCGIGDLDFGTYFWVETAAPEGYEPPDDPTGPLITIDVSNAGTDLGQTTFRDSREDPGPGPTPSPTPTPGPTSTPGPTQSPGPGPGGPHPEEPELPGTGAELGGLLGAAMALLLAGGGFVLWSIRRNQRNPRNQR